MARLLDICSRLTRFLVILLLIVSCSFSEGCRRGSHSAPPATSAPPSHVSVETWSTGAPVCGGGAGVAASSMTPTETQMANLINNYRQSLSLLVLTFNNSTAEGVVQWHAADMNA